MKKKLFILLGTLLLLLAPTFLFAQTYGQVRWPVTSMENVLSFGLFPNPMDAAFNLQTYGAKANFNTLKNNYLFGGLSNFNWSNPLTLRDFNTTLPVTVGFYQHGNMPWSVLGSGYASTSNSGFSNGTTISTTTKTTGTAPTFTANTWVTSTTQEEYKWLDAANIDFGGAFFIGISGIDTGLAVKYYLDQNHNNTAGSVAAWANNNRTVTQTFYYDQDAANANAAPNPAVDYTITSTWNQPDTLSEVYFLVPFMTKLDGMVLSATASLDIVNYDGTTYSSQANPTDPTTKTYSDPNSTGPGATYTNIEANSLTDKEQTITIAGATAVTFPPLLKGNRNNRFVVGLSGNVDINQIDPVVDTYTTQVYNYAGGGADPTRSTRSEYQQTTNYEGFLFYDVELSGAHYLYFDFSPAVVGFAPTLSTTIGVESSGSKYYATTQTTIVRTDGNNDGDFEDAADSISTTTKTYSHNDDGKPFYVDVSVSLPASLKVRPKGWIFGMTFGANLEVEYKVSFVTDVQDTTTTNIHITDGTGTTTSNTTTTAVTGTYSTSKTTQSWTFTNQNLFGLNFFLPGNTTLDIMLNTNNLFEFDSLTAQLVIPL